MRLFDLALLPKLLDSLYGVAAGEETWADALQAYGNVFPNVRLAVVGYEGRFDQANTLAHANFDDDFISSYVDHYYKINPWSDLLMRAPKPPAVVWGHDFVPIDELQRTQFYAEWVRPQGNIATGFASTLCRDPDRYFLMTANVSPDRLEEGQEAAAVFQIIGPHMQRAFELWRRLEGHSLLQSASLDVLNKLSSAVFVVDAQAHVLCMNEKAEQLCSAGELLRTTNRTLSFVAHETQLAVEAYFHGVRAIDDPRAPTMMRLRSTASKSYALFIAPLGETAREAVSENARPACYLFFIIDLSDEPQTQVDALAAALGITRAEALLAQALLEDKTIFDYADERQISRHTVRSQLKSLMNKTETKRQSELIKLLTRMFGTVDFGR